MGAHKGVFAGLCLGLLATLAIGQRVLNIAEKDFSVDVPYKAPNGEGPVLPPVEFAPLTALDQIERFQKRPSGPWDFITSARVPGDASVVWEDLQNFGSLITNSLVDLAVNFRSQDENKEKWIIDLNNGEKLTLLVTETDKENKHHIFVIEAHTSDVFPSLDLTGSPLFVKVLQGSQPGTTTIELGWGGPSISGPMDVAITQMKGLLQRMAGNLEKRFGEICEFGRNIRSIEGDCVNLGIPSRGAAGQALRRLPRHDPAFPDGAGFVPSGATEISPRLISNLVCQQSPGLEVLTPILEQLKGECAIDSIDGMLWEVCPFSTATASMGEDTIHALEWEGIDPSPGSDLVMQFSGGKCNLSVIFACNGKVGLDLASDPCSSKTNRFFHPSACVITPGEDGILQSADGMTDMFWSFGQFIDHDLDLTPVAQLAKAAQPGFSTSARQAVSKDQLPISIPSDDAYLKKGELEFERSIFSKRGDAQSHINQHSSYLDLAQVYGLDNMRARALRSFVDGKLRTSDGNFPPFNKVEGAGALRGKVENAPDAGDRFYVAGDIRANEQSTLLALHILFLREHNLVCDELKSAFPGWDDVKLYQVARTINIAVYQSILYTEWLPKFLGEGVVTADGGSYNGGVDPTVSAVFSTASFRFGHTMVGSFLWSLGGGPRNSASLELIPLRVAFFNPDLVRAQGIDRFLRGAAWHPAKEVDLKVVDELRNFLFTENSEEPDMDLVSLNIQRGRDMGLPSHNKVRDAIGLPEYASFFDLTSDPTMARVLNKVYKGDIEKLDTFVGQLAEDHKEGSIVGPTIHSICADQFRRMSKDTSLPLLGKPHKSFCAPSTIRDGDRFFYKRIDWDQSVFDAYPRLTAILGDKVKLHDIIMRNTGITSEELGAKSSTFTTF